MASDVNKSNSRGNRKYRVYSPGFQEDQPHEKKKKRVAQLDKVREIIHGQGETTCELRGARNT